MNFNYLYTILLFPLALSTYAQEEEAKPAHFFNENVTYQVRSQFSIGGAAPLGLPREIRKIKSYNPTMQLGMEANITKWFSKEQKWGVRLGVRVEGKGMKTDARVKDYITEINYNGAYVKGHFTGDVKTEIRNTYLTFPVLATYNINQQWNVYGGLYFSTAIDQSFDGYVYDGYLRQTNPTGQKLVFEDGKKADYDFSNNVNKFQWGTQIGAEWKVNQHFFLFGDVTYGFNSLLDKDFDAISFSMHNIYLNLGFGYQF
ncbi:MULTISPECIES: porin family protein [unclassified Myroides]|uniref:porin family protein n=1 Tax=unclassified Myroides TaxID=2642485 RepID=UPI003D2F586A